MMMITKMITKVMMMTVMLPLPNTRSADDYDDGNDDDDENDDNDDL